MIEFPSSDEETETGGGGGGGDDTDNERSIQSKEEDESIVTFYQKFSSQLHVDDASTATAPAATAGNQLANQK